MNYWPGTNIFKTRHNAFDWQGKPSIFTHKGGPRITLERVIENAHRHNYEATLGASAGFEIRMKKGAKNG